MKSKHPTDPAQLARWLHVARTGQTRAEYACAVERYAPSARTWRIVDRLTAVGLVALLVWLVIDWGA